MRERGKKAVEVPAAADDLSDFNFSAASEVPCRKHPSSSSVGVCALCLKDRLVKLVCSECGEQRLSSCSCSDVSSSYRNSCSTAMDVGSVGRVSFLIENDKIDPHHQTSSRPKPGDRKPEQVIFLRRSNSSCVEVKKSHGFWRIKRLFRKKPKKGFEINGEICDDNDDRSEIWISDAMGISRSRSLCSFRGFDDESRSAFSSAKISDVTGGVFLDQRKSDFGELEQRKSDYRGNGKGKSLAELDRGRGYGGVQNRSVFPARESDFSGMDESAFIDLKVDLSSEYSAGGCGGSEHGGVNFANLRSGSCRVSVNERGMKRGGKSHNKVWKWIFKYNPGNKRGGK